MEIQRPNVLRVLPHGHRLEHRRLYYQNIHRLMETQRFLLHASHCCETKTTFSGSGYDPSEVRLDLNRDGAELHGEPLKKLVCSGRREMQRSKNRRDLRPQLRREGSGSLNGRRDPRVQIPIPRRIGEARLRRWRLLRDRSLRRKLEIKTAG